jgi:hypothetical protein
LAIVHWLFAAGAGTGVVHCSQLPEIIIVEMKPNLNRHIMREIVDLLESCLYVVGTSLLSVSTAGRGAVSSETAPAFFPEVIPNPGRNV